MHGSTDVVLNRQLCSSSRSVGEATAARPFFDVVLECRSRYDEAEKELLEALAKDSKDADTLANLVVVTLHLGKPSSRYLNQLKASDPNHASLKRTAQFEEAFDRAAQGFSI
jgi:hypothetical protein